MLDESSRVMLPAAGRSTDQTRRKLSRDASALVLAVRGDRLVQAAHALRQELLRLLQEPRLPFEPP